MGSALPPLPSTRLLMTGGDRLAGHPAKRLPPARREKPGSWLSQSAARSYDDDELSFDFLIVHNPGRACRIDDTVLFVADLFHPVDSLSVELFLNGDVCYGSGCRGAVPMLLTWREPDHITRTNFLGRASPPLC